MAEVTYRDGRYFSDGVPLFVVASDYMYFRDRRAHWRDRLEKLRDAGVRVISTYIPWRHHLQIVDGRREYDFTGETRDSRDVVGFLALVASLGFRLIIKPGPFIHSELNIGGLPDLVSPSFQPEIPAALRHQGRPVVWSYDNSQLPAPFDERVDELVREWFDQVRPIIEPYAPGEGRPNAPLLGVQLVDETIYCMSNDPPWNLGYEPSGLRFFHGLLEEKYGTVELYNRLHGTSHDSFADVGGPVLPEPIGAGGDGATSAPCSREAVLQYVDWAEYQWRYRRDLYARYKGYLGIDSTYLTNFAGITPPIEENVPDLQEGAVEPLPEAFRHLYPEWWFAMNRVDRDTDVHEYGLISWLGVAAYDRDVFDRYVNTARRARGINMEENWGFAKLYDERSKHPIVPFYQTLLSVAAGATGYNIFVGVSSDYWDDTLDRVTKLQHPTFPSDAPIDEHGELRSLYPAASHLNQWFNEHGSALLQCELEIDCAYLLYAPYAAVSSWIPDERYWGEARHAIPRCGRDGVEEFSRSAQDAGYSVGFFELERLEERAPECRSLVLRTGFFMEASAQDVVARAIEGGTQVFLCGELPSMDLEWQPCDRLRRTVTEASATGAGRVVYQEESFFRDDGFASVLAEAGIRPHVTCTRNLRAFVHRHPKDDEFFVFFFQLDSGENVRGQVQFYGHSLELELGARTCGVVRVQKGRPVAYLVKGENEVEGTTARVSLKLGGECIQGVGDFSSSPS